MGENNVHLLPGELINENNRLFARGCEEIGQRAEQFPVNVKGCLGSSLCNLGCANGAKQGTHRVQLPRAERSGVEVVTRATAVRIGYRAVHVRVAEKAPGSKGELSEWPAGDYWVRAEFIVLAAGAVGSPALLLRSGLPVWLPRLGEGFSCHPAQILMGEHAREISNDVGHPKSYYLDRAANEGYVLETCMYSPFTTAKSLTGFGHDVNALMQAFPRLQMVLVLACDRALRRNRVTVDRQGRPVVHYTLTRDVLRSLARGSRTAARILFAAGAVKVHAPLGHPPLIDRRDRHRLDERIHEDHFKAGMQTISAAHLMGGCSMGRTAADSVTDVWGRVHGIPWLRVADASLFPDALEINPYVTIMALADRVAEKIREEASWLLASREHKRAG
jgi:choline dehydrogenase-like flavoprotein